MALPQGWGYHSPGRRHAQTGKGSVPGESLPLYLGITIPSKGGGGPHSYHGHVPSALALLSSPAPASAARTWEEVPRLGAMHGKFRDGSRPLNAC